MSGLFDPDATRIYTIPAGANFLESFSQTLATETGLKDNPEALAETLIYLPNRRSERALAFALYKVSGRGACLLPDIRALGDLETDEPPPSAEAALADLPPIMPEAERLGGLTRLVMAYYEANDSAIPAASALAAARALASLLDQAALSGEVQWDKLETLVTDKELAQHWAQSLDFLKIITEQWPVKLEEATAMDPYARRYAAAEAMVQEWSVNPPQGPVIIAGSTGATPASRLIMQAALTLPQGLVVLPGLDRAMSPALQNNIAKTPNHPQFTLVRTLKALNVTPDSVAEWPGLQPSRRHDTRRRLIHEALAPATNTADWTERLSALDAEGNPARFVKHALEGLSLIEAEDDYEEALAAALLLRQTLETQDQTAALITPDAGLARLVSALLKQWHIDVPPSAGLPLNQTKAGSFALLVADWLNDLSHPVLLMAVLNHPLCRFDLSSITTLDCHFLRGPRLWQSWGELRTHIETSSDPERKRYARYEDRHIAEALHLITEIECALGALAGTPDSNAGPGSAFYESIAEVSSEMTLTSSLWTGEVGATLSQLFRYLADLSAPLGEHGPSIWAELFKSEASQTTVQTGTPHPRLAIWGPLESRLQSADHLILAGLNEGIWPAQPTADGFLPRLFRTEIGLSDPDERIGLSAHDFAQLAAAPKVTLLSSKRREDKPAVASRWLWRLRTLARGALQGKAEVAFAPRPEADPRLWITALENVPALPNKFTAEPRPTPPVEARPKALSVTRIEQMVRDPYAIYAEYVLSLRRLDPLDLPTDVRARGTAIHKALERFETDPGDNTPEALLALLEAELRQGGEPDANIAALHARRAEVCAAYLLWREEQAHHLSGAPLTEIRGQHTLSVAGQSFTLSGTADRIERRLDGTIAILDFKSGKPPSEKQVRSGLSPQMPLQGLIAREGGYAILGKVNVGALTYVQFGTQFGVIELGSATRGRNGLPEMDTAQLIAEAEAGLVSLLTAFAQPDHPYLSAPRPERVIYESDFTRLARRDEWVGLDTYD